MYIIMVIDTPEHAPYLVFQIYALICLVRTTVSVWKLYREQNSGNTEKCGDTDVIEKTDDL